MPFILAILFAAFLIESIGTYVSVVGLSHLFSHDPVIIVLAIALDIGKVVGVSFLYKYWKKINLAMKTYMTAATATLMLITSTGCFGYLSGQFQKAMAGTNQDTVLVTALEEEKGRLQSRKQEIDKQIANLPENYARARRQLMQEFAPETNRINNRLAEIDVELPKLKVSTIQKNVDVGPILYVAEAFGTTPEQAVKWVILTVIFVFDPLAIALLIAGNYLIEQRRPRKDAAEIVKALVETSVNETPPPVESKEPVVEETPEPVIETALPVETVPEPVAEPKIWEVPREVITMEKILTPSRARSQLEQVDGRGADVTIHEPGSVHDAYRR